MSKKRVSLRGRGAEILFGEVPDEADEVNPDAEAAPESAAPESAATSPEPRVMAPLPTGEAATGWPPSWRVAPAEPMPDVDWADVEVTPWPELGEIPADSDAEPSADRALVWMAASAATALMAGEVVAPAPWGSSPLPATEVPLSRAFPLDESAPEASVASPTGPTEPSALPSAWATTEEEPPMPAPPPAESLGGDIPRHAYDATDDDASSLPSSGTVVAPAPVLTVDDPSSVAPMPTPPPAEPLDPAAVPPPAAETEVAPFPIAPEASQPVAAPIAAPVGSTADTSWMTVARMRPLTTSEETDYLTARRIVNESGQFDPYEEGPVKPVVPTTLSDEARKAVARHVTAAMLEMLNDEVSSLFDEVEARLSSDRRLTNEALRLLNEARSILLSDRSLYPDAELKARQVRVMLRQSAASSAAAARFGKYLLIWNLIVGSLFMLGLVLDTGLAAWLQRVGVPPLYAAPQVTPDGQTLNLSMAFYVAFWLPMLAGGLGGVLGSLVLVVNSIARRTYDPEYNLRHLVHPIVGIIIGALVYWLFLSGTLLLGAAATGQGINFLDPVQRLSIAANPIVLLTAVALGIAQGPFWRFLDRVVRTVGVAQEEEEAEEGNELPSATATTTTTVRAKS